MDPESSILEYDGLLHAFAERHSADCEVSLLHSVARCTDDLPTKADREVVWDIQDANLRNIGRHSRVHRGDSLADGNCANQQEVHAWR